MTLNRVVGPDPSRIAGHIDANGQVVLVNQSGVTFFKGAQVNTTGLMVSAIGITNSNFMAGKMVFDQPGNPNAKISTTHGTITVKQAGLAALVAPQVANSGVINARLGHVVLAGAKTATLDLYGDGLLSLDVSNQVTQAPVGPDGKAATALVTNTGVIVADGGTVQLTARAADGIVQTLVRCRRHGARGDSGQPDRHGRTERRGRFDRGGGPAVCHGGRGPGGAIDSRGGRRGDGRRGRADRCIGARRRRRGGDRHDAGAGARRARGDRTADRRKGGDSAGRDDRSECHRHR